jgi:Mor family transcriptional regulator
VAATQEQSETVFDSLYERYLPFRLYAEFMLGSTTRDLAKEFRLSENWVDERIQAVRWCLEKQVRLNLLAPAN